MFQSTPNISVPPHMTYKNYPKYECFFFHEMGDQISGVCFVYMHVSSLMPRLGCVIEASLPMATNNNTASDSSFARANQRLDTG